MVLTLDTSTMVAIVLSANIQSAHKEELTGGSDMVAMTIIME